MPVDPNCSEPPRLPSRTSIIQLLHTVPCLLRCVSANKYSCHEHKDPVSDDVEPCVSVCCPRSSAAVGDGGKAKVDAVQLEEEALARIQAAVAERYAAAIAGPEVRKLAACCYRSRTGFFVLGDCCYCY